MLITFWGYWFLWGKLNIPCYLEIPFLVKGNNIFTAKRIFVHNFMVLAGNRTRKETLTETSVFYHTPSPWVYTSEMNKRLRRLAGNNTKVLTKFILTLEAREGWKFYQLWRVRTWHRETQVPTIFLRKCFYFRLSSAIC